MSKGRSNVEALRVGFFRHATYSATPDPDAPIQWAALWLKATGHSWTVVWTNTNPDAGKAVRPGIELGRALAGALGVTLQEPAFY